MNLKAQNTYTLGIGYRGSMFYADLAYKLNSQKADFFPFVYSEADVNVTNYVSGNRSYSSSGRSGDVFPVDEIEKSVEVSTSMELYFALESGLRPLPEQGSAAERIYEKARAVLARITDEGMSDYEKVHAI